MKQTKEQIYSAYGIMYDRKTEKIFHPYFGWIRTLLINGNDKLGRGVYTYSTLATNECYHVDLETVSGPVHFDMFGTCPCRCTGCYATKGRYTFQNVIKANARKTWLSRYDIDFMVRAIIAQVNADHIKICRIHASGDFDSMAYVNAWRRIVKECPDTTFLCFTKRYNVVNSYIDNNGPLPRNLKVLFSGWHNLKPINPHNLPETTVYKRHEMPDPNWLLCGGNCSECSCRGCGCWKAEKGETIAFKIH